MRIQRLTCVAILAATSASLVWLTASVPAQAAACPFVLAKYCVKEKDGYKHTAWTNSCLAKQAGLKILYKGECKGK
jgi:hypothetical protein